MRDVIGEDRTVRISDVAGNEAFEFLLAGGVPQLQSIYLALIVYVFDQKVNTDCLLGISLITGVG